MFHQHGVSINKILFLQWTPGLVDS